ncbi:MAG: ATP-binding protein [Leptospirales bacterium]|nr:ATP-binding protein [Leptospirales bacterium]
MKAGQCLRLLVKPAFYFLSCLLICGGFSSVVAEPLRLLDEARIAPGLYLSELRNATTFEEAFKSEDWLPVRNQSPNYGFADRKVWLRLEVESQSVSDRLIHVDATNTNLLVYVVQSGRTQIIDQTLAARDKETHNRYRAILFPVRFEPGLTTIYFQCTSEDTLYFPLQIWKPDAFQQHRDISTAIYFAYFGAMLVMAAFNLLVFLSTRERSYVPYVLYTISALAYFSSQAGFLMQFIPELTPYWIVKINAVIAGFYIAAAVAFTRSFLRTIRFPRLDKFLLALLFLGVLCGIAAMLPFVKFSYVAISEIVLGQTVVVTMLVAGVHAWRTGYRPARNFVFAFAFFAAGCSVYLLRLIGILPYNVFSAYGIQMGNIAEMLLLSLALSDRINFLRRALERNIRQLETAHEKLTLSEGKYRTIVEDTRDFIFTLDLNQKVVTANHAALRLLGSHPDALVGKYFPDLLYQGPGSSMPFETVLLSNAIDNLSETPAQFRAHFLARHGEPLELALRLEKIGTGSDALILGKAAMTTEDSLLRFLETDRGSYNIDNYLTTSELINQRITRNLPRYFSAEAVEEMQLCLREMIVNAIEHGNLEISYEEKTRAQAQGDYLEYLLDRQKVPRYQNRRVKIEYSLRADRAWFRITDEGSGFDHRGFSATERARLLDPRSSHGRGVAIARRFFDVLRFNEVGNQVVLVRFVNPVESASANSI